MFVNFGTLPSVVADLSPRELELCHQMAAIEMKKRGK